MNIDDSANFWQDSNFFDNVSAGIHIVYQRQKMAANTREIVVVGIPKYFTPNNDSYNDGWELRV
jgi:hypothetical protein